MVSPVGSALGSALYGLTNASNRLERAAQKIASPEATNGQDDVTADALVDVIVAKNDFQANLSVMKKQDEMTQSLLDIFA